VALLPEATWIALIAAWVFLLLFAFIAVLKWFGAV
jgi:hypothetical protein